MQNQTFHFLAKGAAKMTPPDNIRNGSCSTEKGGKFSFYQRPQQLFCIIILRPKSMQRTIISHFWDEQSKATLLQTSNIVHKSTIKVPKGIHFWDERIQTLSKWTARIFLSKIKENASFSLAYCVPLGPLPVHFSIAMTIIGRTLCRGPEDNYSRFW